MRKTKAKPRIVQTGPDFHDGEPHFSPFDLARFELAQDRVVIIQQAIELRRRDAEEADRLHREKMHGIAIETAKLRALKERRDQELRALRAELSTLYDLDLARITYDDETGRIRHLPEGE
jgi:hypothetical protein